MVDKSISVPNSKVPNYDSIESKSITNESSYRSPGGLSVFFTILCIVDLFGVFPVVALPKAVISCGVFGIPVVLFVFSLQIYTAILLGRSWSIAEQIHPMIVEKNRSPYAALAEITFGPRMSNFVTVLLDATIFGGGIPNLLVASQNLQLLGLKLTHYNLNFSFCWWLIIIGVFLCPIMWLGSPKDMKLLSVVSVIIVSSVTIITCYCILSDNRPSYNTDNSFPAIPYIQDVLTAYGIIAFQFDIHPMLLTIQVDMKETSKINNAIIGGFMVSGFIFAVTTILASHTYGMNIKSNILQGLPASYPLYSVVLLVTLQLCLSSAVGSSPLFQHIEDKLGISRDFSSKRCIIRACVVAFAVFLGETVPRFDLVMGLIGSTLTGPLMFIFPPLFYNKLLFLRNNKLRAAEQQNRLNPNNLSNEKKENSCAHSEKDFLLKINAEKSLHLCNTKNNTIKKNIPSISSDFRCNDDTYKGSLNYLKLFTQCDFVVAFFIMCFGCFATCVATFYSWTDVIRYSQFTPPCLLNITAASFFTQS